MSQSLSSELMGQNRPAEQGQQGRGGSLLPSPGWLIGGLAVVALGWMAWNYLGPDVVRYLKIRNM